MIYVNLTPNGSFYVGKWTGTHQHTMHDGWCDGLYSCPIANHNGWLVIHQPSTYL
jgi:hypothetical protein